MWFVMLVVVTISYSIYSAFQDLRERMIYCVPCYILTILWGFYLWNAGGCTNGFLIIFWIIHVIIYIGMNYFKLWGGGDSDYLFLFANVYLASVGNENVYRIIIMECVFICISLFLSIGVGWMEGQVKHMKINLNAKVAVIPGMACVVTLLMMRGLIERCCL